MQAPRGCTLRLYEFPRSGLMTGSRAKRSKRGRRIVDGTGNACERAEGRGAVRALPRCWRTRQGGYSRTNVELQGERPGEAVPEARRLLTGAAARRSRRNRGRAGLRGVSRLQSLQELIEPVEPLANKETQQFRMGCPMLTNQSRAAILPWQACRKYHQNPY